MSFEVFKTISENTATTVFLLHFTHSPINGWRLCAARLPDLAQPHYLASAATHQFEGGQGEFDAFKDALCNDDPKERIALEAGNHCYMLKYGSGKTMVMEKYERQPLLTVELVAQKLSSLSSKIAREENKVKDELTKANDRITELDRELRACKRQLSLSNPITTAPSPNKVDPKLFKGRSLVNPRVKRSKTAQKGPEFVDDEEDEE